MGTRILSGLKVNECDHLGAVFYNSTDNRAFGPVFESTEDAENFLTFLSGVDPGRLTWGVDLSSGEDLYKTWLECGKPAKRPVVQLDPSYIHERNGHERCIDCDALNHGDDEVPHCVCGEEWDSTGCKATNDEPWSMACSLTETCFPLFLGIRDGNHGVTALLHKQGVITKAESTDPEWSCFYAYFKTKEDGLAFLDRLNKWLRDNWHKAYPET